MKYRQGRYSGYIKPIFVITDLIIINTSVFLFKTNVSDVYLFLSYISVLWIIISLKNHFYEVERHTRIVQVVSLLLKQFIIFAIILYAFIGLFKQPNISRLALASYLFNVFTFISVFKSLTYFLLKKYRAQLKGNIRDIIVIGENEKTRQLIKTFNSRLDFGYKFKKQFSSRDHNFNLKQCFDYIKENNIDEIFFSVSELSNNQINELIDFADNNLRVLKFIPDNKEIYTKKLKYEYYDYIPILSLRSIALQDPVNKFLKRGMDILFSLFVIVCVLSWLAPIMALLIALESKGPVFFRQQRNGFNNKKFYCYKFRSMAKNNLADKMQAQKGDVRITRVGRFIRKTSIDELPQFFNVLFGDMSVVGPRPHMLSHTTEYASKVDKFMVRLFVKPGITGLAQVRGFRGEIETDKDIIGRVKYDIFYIENWSFLLDVKIIIQTVLNAVKGEEKAY